MTRGMSKQEILALSRQSTEDEGITNVKNRGLKRNVGVHAAVEAFIWTFIFITGFKRNLPLVYSMLITECTAGATHCIELYRFTKKKENILIAVLCGICAIINGALFVRHIFRNSEKLKGAEQDA